MSPLASVKPLLKRTTRHARRFWHFLTAPETALKEARQRREAQLLTSLIIFLLPVGFVAAALPRLRAGRDFWNDLDFGILIGMGVLSLIVYGLSRSRYYRLTAVLLILNASIGVFAASYPDEISDDVYSLIYLVLPVMMSSIFLSTRVTIIIGICEIIGVIAYARVIVPEYHDIIIDTPLVFLIIASLALILGGYFRNLLERDRQAELAESESRYRTLLDATFEAVLLHEDGILIDANPAFETMFGYTLAEATGMPVLKLAAPEYRRLIVENAENSNSGPYEVVGVRKDGTAFHAELQVKAHRYKDRAVQVVTAHDISERKRVEKQNFELALERERLSVLQRFISDASHDLRTPLANVKTSAYLLKRLMPLSEKVENHLNVIEMQTVHLERVFADLLAMSRLDKAATAEFKFGRVAVNDLIREIIERHGTLAEIRSHHISFVPADDLPPVWADKLKIAQAVNNILLNALNYTPDGGSIALQTAHDDGQIVIEVRDTGIGIEAGDLPHIFDSFYRADAARNVYTGGTGLGLAIARRVVEVHHGSIEVDTKPGAGSTFKIRLPVLSG